MLKSNFAYVSSAMWFHDSRPSLGSGQSIYPICMLNRTVPGEFLEINQCFLNIHIPRFQQIIYDLIPGTWSSVPFTFAAENSSDLTVTMLICVDNCNSTLWSFYLLYTNTSHEFFAASLWHLIDDIQKNFKLTHHSLSDEEFFAIGDDTYAVYINGTRPVFCPLPIHVYEACQYRP